VGLDFGGVLAGSDGVWIGADLGEIGADGVRGRIAATVFCCGR